MPAGEPGVALACAAGLPGATRPVPSLHVLLSPRMPYALLEWRRMQQLAVEAGLSVQAYRDPRVPAHEWAAAASGGDVAELVGIPPLAVEVAQACDMLNHSPTAILTRCGLVHPWPLRGVMPDGPWRHVLAVRLFDLQAMPCP